MRTNAAQTRARRSSLRLRRRSRSPDRSVYGYLAWAGAIVIDTTSTVISAVSATGVTHEAAKVNWTTDENADSQVEYGTTTATARRRR